MSYNKETGLYEGYIYKITNNINGKLYIGQTTTTISERWSQHKNYAKHKKDYNQLYVDMYNLGIENFKVEVLRKYVKKNFDDLKSILNIKEKYYIKRYNTINIMYGYNISEGGNEISDKQKVETFCYTKDGIFIKKFKSRAEAGNYIGVRGEDVADAMLRHGLCREYYFTSEPIFNYTPPQHPIAERKVKSYDYMGNFIKKYINSYEAAKDVNGLPENIYNACRGLHLSAYSYIWRFEEDEFNSKKLPQKRTKSVNQYSSDYKYITTYNSIKEAGLKLNIKPTNISAILSHKQNHKTAKGFHFYYADDPNQPDKTKIIPK